MYRLFIALILSATAVSGFVPQALTHQTGTNSVINPSNIPPREESTKLFERRDASRSGTKRERLDRLAELEETRIETDKLSSIHSDATRTFRNFLHVFGCDARYCHNLSVI